MDPEGTLESAQEEARGTGFVPPTGEYRIIGMIAEGKGTFLYRGEHRRSHYSVVIKTLKPSQRRSRTARRHMANEARVLREISHPCVVRLLSYQGGGRYPYLVLELINGPNVKGWNIRRAVLSSMPGPVSITWTRTSSGAGSVRMIRAVAPPWAWSP